MQLLLKATESKSNFVELGRGCQMPPVKAFMGDVILSSKESTTWKLISFMNELKIWYRMKFKPKKSRSLFLKLNQNVNFEIGG